MKKKNTAIDQSYISTIVAAALTHNPTAPIAKRLGDVLGAIGALEIRRPNDWQFHWTGSAEFRWYDGPGNHFGNSTQWIGIIITKDSANLRGNFGKKSYDREGSVSINDMKTEDGLKVLKVLVSMVDTTSQENK